MLVMYSRFHNYAAENIAAINEDGKLTMPAQGDPDYEAKLKKRDNDIFQTARLYGPFKLTYAIQSWTDIHRLGLSVVCTSISAYTITSAASPTFIIPIRHGPSTPV